jgi:hypothetical protein
LNYKENNIWQLTAMKKITALEEGIEIKQASHSKYLGTVINKTDGIGKDGIKTE